MDPQASQLSKDKVMVGLEEEAKAIALWDMEYDEEDCEYNAPEGFEYLGEGASRIAYRSLTSGFVYKRHYYPDDDTNEFEYMNILRIRDIPLKGWRVPDATLYHIEGEQIIAMEFIEGGMDIHCQRSYKFWNKECDCGKPFGICTADAWEQPEGKWHVEDLHIGNIILQEDGCRVLIDLGA